MFDAQTYHRERLANLEATTGPDAEPWATDRRLREYAHQRARLDAAESFDIARAEKLRIYIYFGCASLLEYLERRVGYSAHAARERIRVARSLATLPVTSAELAKGNLSFSTVRELSRIATPETEAAWVERARFKTCREVEQMVAGHAPGDTPDDPAKPELQMKDLRISLPTEHHALWREARKKLADECGAENVSDAALFEALCRNFLQPGTGTEGPPHQIAYKQCNDCKRATQNGAGREFPIATSVFERASCDARIIGSVDAPEPERARSTVSPRMREQVFARDGQRCQIPGCRSSRNLEIHHIIEQAAGGPHEMWNLTTLCGGHHAARHEGLIEITGRAPSVKVKWLIPGENEVTRAALLEREIEEVLHRTQRVPGGTSTTISVDATPYSDGTAMTTSILTSTHANEALTTNGTSLGSPPSMRGDFDAGNFDAGDFDAGDGVPRGTSMTSSVNASTYANEAVTTNGTSIASPPSTRGDFDAGDFDAGDGVPRGTSMTSSVNASTHANEAVTTNGTSTGPSAPTRGDFDAGDGVPRGTSRSGSRPIDGRHLGLRLLDDD